MGVNNSAPRGFVSRWQGCKQDPLMTVVSCRVVVVQLVSKSTCCELMSICTIRLVTWNSFPVRIRRMMLQNDPWAEFSHQNRWLRRCGERGCLIGAERHKRHGAER